MNIINIVYLIIGFLVGGGIGVYVGRKNKSENINTLNAEKLVNKKENLIKILELFQSNTEITNNEVQKQLGVSDATATNYLDELENEGRITQVGNVGKSVSYRLR